jgi:hypothetical protein
MMELIDRKGGVHHKMASILDKVFNSVKKVGGDIGEHKWWHMSQHTWKDSNSNTMYMN